MAFQPLDQLWLHFRSLALLFHVFLSKAQGALTQIQPVARYRQTSTKVFASPAVCVVALLDASEAGTSGIKLFCT
jgi:hypothetical protein